KDAIHDREDSSCRRHAESEYENRDGSKAGRLAQHTAGEAKVLKQYFDEKEAAGFAVVFLGLLWTTKKKEHLTISFSGREAAVEVFVHGELQMRGDFGVEVAVEFSPIEKGTDTIKQLTELGDHGWNSFVLHGTSPSKTIITRSAGRPWDRRA